MHARDGIKMGQIAIASSLFAFGIIQLRNWFAKRTKNDASIYLAPLRCLKADQASSTRLRPIFYFFFFFSGNGRSGAEEMTQKEFFPPSPPNSNSFSAVQHTTSRDSFHQDPFPRLGRSPWRSFPIPATSTGYLLRTTRIFADNEAEEKAADEFNLPLERRESFDIFCGK